jgi:hypothetical protein
MVGEQGRKWTLEVALGRLTPEVVLGMLRKPAVEQGIRSSLGVVAVECCCTRVVVEQGSRSSLGVGVVGCCYTRVVAEGRSWGRLVVVEEPRLSSSVAAGERRSSWGRLVVAAVEHTKSTEVVAAGPMLGSKAAGCRCC